LNEPSNTATEQKNSIRAEALEKRDSIPSPVKRAKDSSIMERLFALEEFGIAKRVLFYASFRSEVNTAGMIEAALSNGKKVLLPKVDNNSRTLTKHVISGMHEVSPGYMGIPEPDTDVRLTIEEIDLIVVPGVAFDTRGWRIGYGGGYYDRLLPRVKGMRTIAALAYEEQIFGELTPEDHDIGMDLIITDKRTIECHG
jgi:5-formyltetrahydrofolate cyclo-ligase